MTRFLIRRILQGILVLWLITVGVFLIFFVGPGPNAVPRALAGEIATPPIVAEVTRRLLLDKSIPAAVLALPLAAAARQPGLLVLPRPVGELDPRSGLPDHPVPGDRRRHHLDRDRRAVRHPVRGQARTIADRAFTGLALLFYSMPTFVLGLLFLLVFYYELTIHGVNAFPGSTFTPLTQNPWPWFRGLILPWFTLALVSAATYTRLTRGSMLDVMSDDYIRTARAKGLSERRVIFRHSLRAALTPVVTQFGLDVGILLGGAVITEVVFSMPGLGFTAVQAIDQQDLPVIIGVVIIASAAVVVANIVVDAFYAVLDPRVRLH